MNLKTLHALADLATDAVEAIVHWWNSDRAADELWERPRSGVYHGGPTPTEGTPPIPPLFTRGWADKLAEAEAEQEVWEPKSSVAAPKVSADSAATERPAPPSIRGDVEAPGTPVGGVTLWAAASFLRRYSETPGCQWPDQCISLATELENATYPAK